jgi:hypothetical protein
MRTACTSLMLCLFLVASPRSTWVWYPVNSLLETGQLDSGLKFYFENPPDSSASITVWGKRGDEPFEVSAVIDTDGVHGDTFLRFDIRDFDTFIVDKMRIRMGKFEQIVEKPHQGTHYVF